MPDITMCQGGTCPIKEECYRFKAVPSQYRQSYFAVVPYSEENKHCEYRWSMKPENKKGKENVEL
jgi:hypothetical protein